MWEYAAETNVPPERTRAEIEACVMKYGCKSFQSGWRENRIGVEFISKEDRPVALRVTQDGHPEHPLFVPYDVTPIPFLGLDR